MARLKDHEHPFFRPLWRRIAVVAVCLVWALIEYIGGSANWAMIALAFAAYGAWQFFYLYKPVDQVEPASESEGEAGPKE